MTIKAKEARIGSGEDAYRFILKNGVQVADAEHSVSDALVPKLAETRNAMDYHPVLGCTNKNLTRTTAKTMGTICSGSWQPYIGFSVAKAHRVAVSKITTDISKKKVRLLFIPLSDSKSGESLKGLAYVMIIIDYFTTMKGVSFMPKKDKTGDVLRLFVANVESRKSSR